MKIALVVHNVSKQRGHDRYVAELATQLSKEHEVHIYANTCAELNSQNRIFFHRVPLIEKPTLLKILSFLLTSTWMLRKREYDVIHAQGVCGLIQDVVTAHTCQVGWRKEYVKLEHAEGGSFRRLYHLLVMRITEALERYIYQTRHSKHVIAISNRIKKEINGYYNRSEESITTIYNGVNLDEFHPGNISQFRGVIRIEYDIPEDTFTLLYVGEFKRKGLRYAIEALSLLSDKSNLLLLVVGGDEAKPYTDLAQHLDVEKMIKFVGHTDRICQFYAASDALIFPTLYEPFGFAIVEAMATGIPVITSRSAGASELISNRVDGLLLDNPKNPYEIAKNITLLIKNENLRYALGKKGRIKVESHGWDKFAKQVLKIYLTTKS